MCGHSIHFSYFMYRSNYLKCVSKHLVFLKKSHKQKYFQPVKWNLVSRLYLSAVCQCPIAKIIYNATFVSYKSYCQHLSGLSKNFIIFKLCSQGLWLAVAWL